MLKTSSINTITQLSCPTPPSLSYALTLFSFQLCWSPNCPINALSLIPISFHPPTMLLFLTPPGTGPVSSSPLTCKNLYPLPTINPYLSQNLAVPTPQPVLLLQLISLGTSSHPCHVWLLITLSLLCSQLLPQLCPSLPPTFNSYTSTPHPTTTLYKASPFKPLLLHLTPGSLFKALVFLTPVPARLPQYPT